MTKAEFAKIVKPMATIHGVDVDKFTWATYYDALQHVPVPILAGAVQKSLQGRKWFPKPSELLEDAESVRLERRSAMQFNPCMQCEDSNGWVEIEVDGVKRVTRCQCWHIHQQKVKQLAGAEPLALPAAETEADA